MNLGAVRQALADAADVVQGLTTYPYTPDSVTVPCFYPAEYDIEFDQAFAGGCDVATVTCRILVGRADDRAAQEHLDAYLARGAATSLKDALEAARGAPGQPALGGAADDLHVQRVQRYGQYTVGQTNYVGAELIVRVIGPGS